MSAPNDTQTAEAALDLEACTLDEIVDVLISGKSIALPLKAGNFALVGDDARAILQFYAGRRDLWPQQKQVSSKEVDEVLAVLESPKTQPPELRVAPTKAIRPRWRITRVEAHRFAGLHRHCGDKGQAPDPLTVELDREVTCIWGFNGAGKTAFQSAIMWCLTGRALRSQHMPDEIHEPMAIDVESDNPDAGSGPTRTFSIPPIVPLPSAADLLVLNDRPAVDTWVRLTLRNQTGYEIQVKRSLLRNARGTISVQVHGREHLDLPDVAIEAGTLLPAIASAMRFDERTTFAAAIAQLTGLKPMEDLGHRAVRLERRLSGEEITQVERIMEDASIRFTSSKRTFAEGWESNLEALGPLQDLLAPDRESPEAGCAAAIQSAKGHLESVRDNGQADIAALLGAVPPLASNEQITSFIRLLDEAKEHLGNASIGNLPSVGIAKRIGAIDASDRERARAILSTLRDRATAHVARLKDQAKAARWQLYALVGQWHNQHHHGDPLADCPVCGSNLDEVPADALLDTGIAEALRKSMDADADVAKSLLDWQRDAARELLDTVPERLRSFADTSPPASLLDVYRAAFVAELLGSPTFSNQLHPLKQNAQDVWQLAVAAHPLLAPPAGDPLTLPPELASGMLATRFANLQAVIALAEHRELSEAQIRALTLQYIGSGGPESSVRSLEETVARAPLRHQVVTLRRAIDASKPIIALLRQLGDLEAIRQRWQKAHQRYQLLLRAAQAVKQFTRFPDLVHRQVEGLIDVLESRTKQWLDRLYRPHYVGGPAYCGLDPTQDHGVGLYAGLGTLRVRAHEVMNSSQLRACVWAFALSLWERVRDKAGIVDVLLLDDPQTHFDPINMENLAAAVPYMVQAGMAPIITSNDNRFIAAVRDKLPKVSTNAPTWTTLLISPVSSSRLTAAFGPSVEEVFERRDAWLADENDVGKAQQFVERVRLHVENRLWDLLAGDPMLMYRPTLADLLGHLGSARNSGERPFNESPFARLLANKALRSGARFYVVINQAHHDLRNVTPQDAGTVNEAFDEVDRLLRSCTAAYARFMGRLTREDEEQFYSEPPPAPAAIDIATKAIPILGAFSARTYADAVATEAAPETYSFAGLGDVALFAIRGGSLGTLALPGQVVMVSCCGEAKNGEPVIALYGSKALARRYHPDRTDAARITLTCDLSGTESVAPALMLPRSKVRLMPIVGILYDDVSRVGTDEAQQVDVCQILDKPLVAARVADDSGYPVVRNGDIVLLEAMDLPDEAKLNRMKGAMVAFVAARHGEQFAYLKRIGASIQGNLRLFENVGAYGDSLAVLSSRATTDVIGETLTLQRIWHVHGVLRTRT